MMGAHPTISIHRGLIVVPMATEADEKSQFYCNYCGEPVSVGVGMFDHMRAAHPTEMMYDTTRRTKSIMIGVVGTVIIVLVTVMTAFFFGAEMGEDWTTLFVIASVFLALVLYVGCGIYETRGMKPGDEVVMDLLTDCDVCGKRMQYRDLDSHVTFLHPEEHLAEKNVDAPIQWMTIAIMGSGYVGFGVSYILHYFTRVSDAILFIAITGSVAAAGLGTALLILHGEFIYRPRTRRLAKEWAEKHPRHKAK